MSAFKFMTFSMIELYFSLLSNSFFLAIALYKFPEGRAWCDALGIATDNDNANDNDNDHENDNDNDNDDDEDVD